LRNGLALENEEEGPYSESEEQQQRTAQGRNSDESLHDNLPALLWEKANLSGVNLRTTLIVGLRSDAVFRENSPSAVGVPALIEGSEMRRSDIG